MRGREARGPGERKGGEGGDGGEGGGRAARRKRGRAGIKVGAREWKRVNEDVIAWKRQTTPQHAKLNWAWSAHVTASTRN